METIITVITSICGILMGCYLVLMLLYRLGWEKAKTRSLNDMPNPDVPISIIIPARNEAHNLPSCLNSLLQQDYPGNLFEIVVIDDHSEDETVAVVQGFNDPRVKCLQLSQYLNPGEQIIAYKKRALALGIANSSGELIVTTDADCVAGRNWLRHLAAVYRREEAVMIIAPVNYTGGRGLLNIFQSIDFLTMQGITAASTELRLGSMSNGANLAFSRTAYERVEGYAGTEHLASGDDFLMTVKMNRLFPESVVYLKSPEAIIDTVPPADWSGFFQQRIRWASKSGKYQDPLMTASLMLVYVVNLSFVPAVALALLHSQFVWLPIGMLLVKLMSELILVFPVAGFFEKKRQLWAFPFLQPIHISYVIVAGLLGMLGQYKWKGRHIVNMPANITKRGKT